MTTSKHNMMNSLFPYATPESQGIPSEKISAFVSELDLLEQSHAFILIRHGKTIAQGAWKPYTLTLPHELFSLSKSFISCAIGIAWKEGLLNIEDKLVSFFPEYLTEEVSPEMQQVTLKDLLTMSCGHDRCSFAFVDFAKGDWVKEILTSPLVYPPGTHFVYNSGGTFMLSAVLRKVTGMNPVDYLQPRLFEPLGIIAPQWDCNPQGINIGGWGLWLTTEEVARFAFMLLHHGQWQGKQLVPKEYLQEATAFQADNSMNEQPDWKVGYGYQFWRCQHNAFRGDGAAGQYALVMPEQDMILAFHSGMRNMQQVLTAVWEHLLPASEETPLPANPVAEKELRCQLDSLKAKLPEGFASGKSYRTGEGKYRLVQNQCGFKELTLSFHQDECVLEIDGIALAAGYGKYAFSEIPLASTLPKQVAAQAAWKDENHLTIFALCLQTTARFTFELTFCEDHVTVHRTTPIFFFSDKGNVVFHGRKTTK